MGSAPAAGLIYLCGKPYGTMTGGRYAAGTIFAISPQALQGDEMNATTTERIVPSVSSGTAGPLGAIHLPRLWLKLSLAAAGKLPGDYDECGSGFDAMTLNALGLDRQKTIDFIRQRKPTYMEFEEWVVQNGRTDKATIEQHNAAIRGYNHGDDLALTMRTSSKVKDASVKDAVTLNTVEDLDAIHAQLNSR